MKIVRVAGGLGNQMFQYAFGVALGHANPSDHIKYDCTFYDAENTSQEGLELERIFSLSLNKATREDIAYIYQKKNRLIHRVLRNIHPKYHMQLEEDVMHIPPWLFSMKQDVEYMGYWQSEQYFQNCKDEIRKIFSFHTSTDPKITKLLQRIDEDTSSVALHIRKGDYMNNPQFSKVHGFLDMKYYQRAIDIMKRYVPSPNFYIFSDDIEWSKRDCKDIASPENLYFVDDMNDRDNYYYTIEAMRRCKHNIIAHSSFSWWGAWLNENPNKTVIAPNKWYATTKPSDYKKITDIKIPASWHLASTD